LAGKYVVERVLGVGGMGVVVAARHQLLGGRVALKFVLPQLVFGDAAVQRFLREAQAATQITSEHVARVTDVGLLEHGAPYMVMEYLEGKDLGSVLEARGPLPVAEAVDYLLQALQAVAEAHAKGIVHRDLKPSNMFLTRRADGSPLVKVLDFGIAKAILEAPDGRKPDTHLTATQGLLGSPLYMSPEQIRSSKYVDHRSDVWAIGVVLHELLSRKHPFTGDSAPALLAAISADAPLPLRTHRPDAPPAIERLILECLEKDRERRTASVAIVAERLAGFGTDDARLSFSRIRGVSGYVPQGEMLGRAEQAAQGSGTTGQTGGIWAGTLPEGDIPGVSKRGRISLALALGGLALAAAVVLLLRLRGGDVSEAPAAPAAEVARSSERPAPIALPERPVAPPSPPVQTTLPTPSPAVAPLPSTAPSLSAKPKVAVAPSKPPPASAKPAAVTTKRPEPSSPAPTRKRGVDDLINERN
jgi:serine/threonine-protein kinase